MVLSRKPVYVQLPLTVTLFLSSSPSSLNFSALKLNSLAFMYQVGKLSSFMFNHSESRIFRRVFALWGGVRAARRGIRSPFDTPVQHSVHRIWRISFEIETPLVLLVRSSMFDEKSTDGIIYLVLQLLHQGFEPCHELLEGSPETYNPAMHTSYPSNTRDGDRQ